MELTCIDSEHRIKYYAFQRAFSRVEFFAGVVAVALDQLHDGAGLRDQLRRRRQRIVDDPRLNGK